MAQNRFWDRLVLLGLASALLYRLSVSIVDLDLFHEMALAREIVERGFVPWEDSFAYTPTVFPSVHHEWGAGMVGFFLATWGGGLGIIAAKFLLAFALGAICWICARRRGASVAVLNFLGLLAILLADEGFSPIRAQLYSFVFCACLMYWLDRDREGERRWIWAWLVVFVVWLNLHAGFLVGAGLFALHWLEQVARRQPHKHLLAAGIAMIGLIAVNPYGLHYYGYLGRAVAMPRPFVPEWGPLWSSGDAVNLLCYLLSLALFFYALWRVGLKNLPGAALVLVTAVYAFKHHRMLPFYAITWFSIVPAAIEVASLGEAMRNVCAKWRGAIASLWCAATVCLLYVAATNRPWELRVPGQNTPGMKQALVYPVGAVEYLKANRFCGNLMTRYGDGSYVIWKLYPQVRVSMDSRYEVAYPPQIAQENQEFYLAQPGWSKTLRRYPTDAVLVPHWSPVAGILTGQIASQEGCREIKNWKQVYRDNEFSIFVRSDLRSSLPAVERSDSRMMGTFP